MSDNVGLSTPRGSGTSGYVQRNRAFIRPRDNAYGGPHGNSNPRDLLASQQGNRLRQPDQGILEHDRKRAIAVRVFTLRDELEEKGELDQDAIDQRCEALQKQLTEEAQRNGGNGSSAGNGDVRQRFKAHQVHEQARAKIVESERLRRALRINKGYEEGEHWRRQDERQQKRKAEDDHDGARGGNEPPSATDVTPLNDKRRRRYSTGSKRSDSSDRRASPPLRSIEQDHDGRRGRATRSSRGRDSDRKATAKRDPSYSDESEGEIRKRQPVSKQRLTQSESGSQAQPQIQQKRQLQPQPKSQSAAQSTTQSKPQLDSKFR
ncbi:RNA-splicing factor [Sporothrix epigloea]|uniref:RNA-splicing factor n=1 Tax=Sporothrix epigloea TaxID=1892477 RepID=A0ABP0DN29_9PEZI